MSSRSVDTVPSRPLFGSLRRTVKFSLVGMGCLAVVITVCSLLLHDAYQRQARESIDGELVALKALTKIVTATSICRDCELGLVRHFSDAPKRSEQVAAWQSACAELDQALQDIAEGYRSRSHAEMPEEPSTDGCLLPWRNATTNYRRQFLAIVNRVDRGELQTEAAVIAALEPVTKGSTRLIEEARRATDAAARSADQSVLALQSDITRGKMLVVVRGLIPIGLLVVIGIMFSRLVLRRLALIADTLRAIARGDLSARAPVDSEDEIGIVARHLNEMAETIQVSQDRLEESRAAALMASQSKSQFLANMSHEIRTPMTAILGFADELSRSPLRPEEADLAGTIARNGQHLLHVVNDILDLSRIEAGKLTIQREWLSLTELLAEIQRLMRLRIENRDLRLTFENPATLPELIETDPTRLRQILINLIGNAIKFTESGSIRVVTTLQGTDSPAARLHFEVIDTGVGMNPEQLAKLFQPFSQVDGRSARYAEGTGLGLVICKHLAEALGGEISVVSEQGLGSTFAVAVPIGPLKGVQWVSSDSPSSGEIVVAESADGVFRQMRILVVEDGLDNQRLIVRMLERAGARVDLVSNGAQALEAVARGATADTGPFHVILMDMQMPVLNGYEATAQLRAGGYRRPIVALTANAMQHDRERCLDAGCDDYVSKPIQRRELLQILSRYAPSASADSVSAST